MTAELRTERRDSTLVLTFSDPASRNALVPQALTAAVEALNVAEADATVRAVVLVGEGAHFSAGSDLQRLANDAEILPGDAAAHQLHALRSFVEALRAHPKPVIAAVEGAATAAAGATTATDGAVAGVAGTDAPPKVPPGRSRSPRS